MRYLSLFSGIEAASCAWQSLGWELVGLSEIEKFPCNVLKRHYPKVPNLGDIAKITSDDLSKLGHIDLIVGGSPCQGFSVAGKQEGLKDERSGLAKEYIRVLSIVKPKWLVWENVPGVFGTNGGDDFRSFVKEITDIGYGICWRVLDAQYFGVAQRRRRVFLVGYLGDWRPAYKVLFECESLPRYLEALKRTKENLAKGTKRGIRKTGSNCLNPWSNVPPVVGEGAFYSYKEVKTASTLKAAGGALGGGSENFVIGLNGTEKMCPVIKENGEGLTLVTRHYKDPPIILDDQGGRVMNVSADGKVGTLRAETHSHQPIVTEIYRISSYHSNAMKSDNPNSGIYKTDLSNTLDAPDPTPACQQGGIAVVSSAAFKPEQGSAARGVGWKEEQSLTLTGNAPAVSVQGYMIGRKEENGPQGNGVNIEKSFTLNTTDCHALYFHARVRKLTPIECLRLQGFPDDWFEGVEGYSDTAAYKAIGNSMAVPCMRWVGKMIERVNNAKTD